MKPPHYCLLILLPAAWAGVTPLRAQTWVAGAGDFRVEANWNPAGVPGESGIARINNAGTATLGDGPDLEVGGLALGGDGSGAVNQSGSLEVNGGVLSLSRSENVDSFVGDTAQDAGTVAESRMILIGGTVLVDDPDGVISFKSGFSRRFDFLGNEPNSWDTSGWNNKDLLVGVKTRGRLELHGGAKLFLGDDLGLANNGGGDGQEAALLMDGDSLIGIGSGAEVGKLNAKVTMTLAGNAVFAAGNSLGPGNAAGQTDEGYFTVGTRDSGEQTVRIRDNAELQCMTLQNRLGNTEIELTGQAKLKIHNVFAGSGTIMATRPSYLASGAGGTFILTLRDTSSLLVDCTLGNTASMGPNGVNGLHVAGGENLQSAVTTDPASYNSTSGGMAILDIRDEAMVEIRQGLHLGFGTGVSAAGTLRVEGPEARVSIGGNLNLAFNEYVDALSPGSGARPGIGELHCVLTGPGQQPVKVAGRANISNGVLRLTLADYVPAPGDFFPVLDAATVDGPFREVDLNAAPLPGGQTWYLNTTATGVTAQVWPPVLTVTRNGADAVLSWPGPGQLQYSPDLRTGFQDVAGAGSPYTVATAGGKAFYRLRQ